MSSKVRPFQPAAITLHIDEPDKRDVRTIPQLIEYNGRHNPDYIFCVQARKQQSSIYVSCYQLKQAILQCSDWLTANIREIESPFRDANGELCKGPPVALSVSSDIGLLVYLLSLLSLGVPVLLLSARLSPSAISHLILETSTRAIICAPNHKNTVQEVPVLLAQHCYPTPIIPECPRLMKPSYRHSRRYLPSNPHLPFISKSPPRRSLIVFKSTQAEAFAIRTTT